MRFGLKSALLIVMAAACVFAFATAIQRYKIQRLEKMRADLRIAPNATLEILDRKDDHYLMLVGFKNKYELIVSVNYNRGRTWGIVRGFPDGSSVDRDVDYWQEYDGPPTPRQIMLFRDRYFR